MSWVAAATSAAGFVVDSIGAGVDADNANNNSYAQNKNNAQQQYANTINQREQYLANTQDQRDMMDYMSNQGIDNKQTDIAREMYGQKYSIAQNQANYDAFQAEFGDMQDNMFSYFKNLSSSGIKAQNNENVQKSLNTEMDRLQQSFTERGINPSSGLYQAAQMQLQTQADTAGVQMNRNVDKQVAQEAMAFSDHQENSKFGARAQDFNTGILDTQQRNDMTTDHLRGQRDFAQASEYQPNSWDVVQAETTKAKRKKFLGIF